MPPEHPPIAARKACILIVDDDPLFLDVAAATLTDAGYIVESAATGAAWSAAVSANHIDLMILDCEVTGPSELAILDRLQHSPYRCAVMILSSRSEAWHDRVMKLYGAQSVVSKPIDAGRLLAVVGQILNAGN